MSKTVVQPQDVTLGSTKEDHYERWWDEWKCLCPVWIVPLLLRCLRLRPEQSHFNIYMPCVGNHVARVRLTVGCMVGANCPSHSGSNARMAEGHLSSGCTYSWRASDYTVEKRKQQRPWTRLEAESLQPLSSVRLVENKRMTPNICFSYIYIFIYIYIYNRYIISYPQDPEDLFPHSLRVAVSRYVGRPSWLDCEAWGRPGVLSWVPHATSLTSDQGGFHSGLESVKP